MEFFRRAANPWGQEVLLGIAWDLFWVAVVAGAAFVAFHMVWVRGLTASGPAAAPTDSGLELPATIERHSLAARAFHWSMTVAMFALLITAFFPVMGIRFPWVTIHWIAGVALMLVVAYHIVHSMAKQDLWSMWIDGRDVAEGSGELKGFLSRSADTSQRTGKYPVDHKLYHHAAAVAALGAIVTGALMMFRIETPLWAPHPYILSLSDGTWGLVYVIHGLSSVALTTLIITHVYFAVRPEKRWMTWSMIHGRIDAARYREHYDPERWVLPGSPPPAAMGAGARQGGPGSSSAGSTDGESGGEGVGGAGPANEASPTEPAAG